MMSSTWLQERNSSCSSTVFLQSPAWVLFSGFEYNSFLGSYISKFVKNFIWYYYQKHIIKTIQLKVLQDHKQQQQSYYQVLFWKQLIISAPMSCYHFQFLHNFCKLWLVIVDSFVSYHVYVCCVSFFILDWFDFEFSFD